MFQPLPEPVSSSGVSVPLAVAVWLTPVSVALGNVIDDGGVSPRLPPVQVIVYATIVPELPDAEQWFVSVQLTSLSVFVVPDAWLAHVVPPFVVVSMRPLAPAAQQLLALAHQMPFRADVVPDVCPAQVEPFEVTRMVPLAPATQQCVESVHVIAFSAFDVPEVWLDQVVPSVVARIVPLAPTAKHVVVLRQEMLFSAFVAPEVCPAQVVPFVVTRMAPLAPTAQQCVVSGHATSLKLLVTPET